jgi:hypothetical protein
MDWCCFRKPVLLENSPVVFEYCRPVLIPVHVKAFVLLPASDVREEWKLSFSIIYVEIDFVSTSADSIRDQALAFKTEFKYELMSVEKRIAKPLPADVKAEAAAWPAEAWLDGLNLCPNTLRAWAASIFLWRLPFLAPIRCTSWLDGRPLQRRKMVRGGKSGLHGNTVPGNARRGYRVRPESLGKVPQKADRHRFVRGQGWKGGVRAHRGRSNADGTANPTGSKTKKGWRGASAPAGF